jgi:hypothetical protein
VRKSNGIADPGAICSPFAAVGPLAAVDEHQLAAALVHDCRVLGHDTRAAEPDVAGGAAADDDSLFAEARNHG